MNYKFCLKMQLEDGQWHSGLPQTQEQHLALIYRVILHWISEIDLSDGNAQKLFIIGLGYKPSVVAAYIALPV